MMLDGTVHSILYVSRSKNLLINNANQFLQKNIQGFWSLYDDGYGKKTYRSWQYTKGSSVIAYAQLNNNPTNDGFYSLHIASGRWNEYLDQLHGNNNNNTTETGTEINV
jgi:hypothetical protein